MFFATNSDIEHRQTLYHANREVPAQEELAMMTNDNNKDEHCRCACSRDRGAACAVFAMALTSLLLQTQHTTAFVLNNSIRPSPRRPRGYRFTRHKAPRVVVEPSRCASSLVTGTGSNKASHKKASTGLFAQSGATIEKVKRSYGGGAPVRTAAEAKTELLRLLSNPTAEVEDPLSYRERMDYLLETLEAGYIPIQTVGFLNLATKGTWHLAYSSSPMPPLGPRLETRELSQSIDPADGKEGAFTNVLVWHLIDEDIVGRLEVKCGYEIDPRGRMYASLQGHRLLPDGKMPKNPEELVVMLQRAVPYELFDPNEHALETSFLDESLRVVRMRGARHEGRLNIFLRDLSVLEPRGDTTTEARATINQPTAPSAQIEV